MGNQSALCGETSRTPAPCALLCVAKAVLLAVLVTNGATAADNDLYVPGRKVLTVYGGFRDGGSFEDLTTGKSVDIKSSATYAMSLDFPLDETRQFQVFYSFQDTSLGFDVPSGSAPIIPEFPMQVMYLQIGGTTFVDGDIGEGLYLVGGLGATLFYPTLRGFDSEMRLSANVGLGYEQPLGKRMALRFEARGYFTLVNSSSAMFCSAGCAIAISGEGISQGELSIGLAFGL